MFEEALVYEEDVFGTPVPVGVQSAAGVVERFVERAEMPSGPVLSAPVTALLAAVEAVLVQVLAELPGSQALADTAALLSALERLRGAVLPRLADVETRKLHVLDGVGSASAWVAAQQTSIDGGMSRCHVGWPVCLGWVRRCRRGCCLSREPSGSGRRWPVSAVTSTGLTA